MAVDADRLADVADLVGEADLQRVPGVARRTSPSRRRGCWCGRAARRCPRTAPSCRSRRRRGCRRRRVIGGCAEVVQRRRLRAGTPGSRRRRSLRRTSCPSSARASGSRCRASCPAARCCGRRRCGSRPCRAAPRRSARRRASGSSGRASRSCGSACRREISDSSVAAIARGRIGGRRQPSLGDVASRSARPGPGSTIGLRPALSEATLSGVDVDADDRVSIVGERGARDAADVAETEN